MSQYMILMFLIMAFLMLAVLFIEHEISKKQESDDLNDKQSEKEEPSNMASAINTCK